MRPTFLALLLLLTAASSPAAGQRPAAARTVAQLPEVDEGLKFIVFGDWGRQGRYGQADVARGMAAAAERLDADFIVSTGDNFYPNGVQSTQDANWRHSFEDVYREPPLWIDWWVVLGNHDYRGNPQAEIDYSQVSRRWRMPARYYAREFPVDDSTTALFAFLDTSPFVLDYRDEPDKYAVADQDTVAQVRWLDSVLTHSRARWKFVVGHHHIYSGGKRTVLTELERQVVPVMQRHGVTAYFNGHEHDLQHIVRPGSPIHYFVSGAGSEVRPTGQTEGTRFAASAAGFLTVIVQADAVDARFFNAAGRELYRTRIPAR